MEETKPFGSARDGKVFTAESQEVIDYMTKYPDVTIEVAIGTAVLLYERYLDGLAAVPATGEVASSEETVE